MFVGGGDDRSFDETKKQNHRTTREVLVVHYIIFYTCTSYLKCILTLIVDSQDLSNNFQQNNLFPET